MRWWQRVKFYCWRATYCYSCMIIIFSVTNTRTSSSTSFTSQIVLTHSRIMMFSEVTSGPRMTDKFESSLQPEFCLPQRRAPACLPNAYDQAYVPRWHVEKWPIPVRCECTSLRIEYRHCCDESMMRGVVCWTGGAGVERRCTRTSRDGDLVNCPRLPPFSSCLSQALVQISH